MEKLPDLLRKRKDIVHYSQLASDIYVGTFINYNDTEKLEEAQKTKESFPALFKQHIEYTFIGFELAIKLINEKGTRK